MLTSKFPRKEVINHEQRLFSNKGKFKWNGLISFKFYLVKMVFWPIFASSAAVVIDLLTGDKSYCFESDAADIYKIVKGDASHCFSSCHVFV